MASILVTGAGGAPALNFTRSLRAAPHPFRLVGTDADRFYLLRAETDERYLVPPASHPDYIRAVNEIIEREAIDLVHAQNDVEVGVLSQARDELAAPVFLPSPATVAICQDKWQSYLKWRDAAVPAPATWLLEHDDDLVQAFSRCDGRVWLRAITGAGGRGAMAASDLDAARSWVDLHDGWGSFTAAEQLTEATVTWMSLWHDGELVVAQGRKRLYWEMSKLSSSGVTGATGAGVTMSDGLVDDVSAQAVRAIDAHPHGLYGVDLTYDDAGGPRVTEINIGRFFTTHQFFTELGLNMPLLFVRLGLGHRVMPIEPRLNPLPDGRVWIRGMDMEPVLTSLDEIAGYVADLDRRSTGWHASS